MKRFLSFFKGQITVTCLAPLLKMAEALIELIVPLIVASIIDKGLAFNDKPYIVKMCLLLVLLGVFGLAISLTAQYFSAKSATTYAKKIRKTMMNKIQNVSYSQIDKVGTSSIVNTMVEDVTQVQTGINLILRLFLRSPFIVFGAVIFALSVDFKSSYVFLILLPILSVCVFFVMGKGVKQFKNARKTADELTLTARENVYGVREVKAFNLQQKQIAQFENNNKRFTEQNVKSSNFVSFLNPLTFALINFAIILLIYSGALRVNYGALSQGKVVALYNYMSQILVELIKLVNLTINVSKTIASWERVCVILDMPQENGFTKKIEPNFSELAIEFSNVTFKYPASGNVLQNINLKIESGQTIGITGATGCGKTTLVSLIYGGYLPTEGSVKIFGQTLCENNVKSLRDIVSVAFQKSVLFKGTIKENMLWGDQSASDEQIENALKLACAYDFIAEKGGINCPVLEGGKNFSGGQRQRIALARALLKQSSVLVLDDAFSALDYATEDKVLKNIASLNKTVIIISQRLSGLKNCDKIVVLDDGKIQAFDTRDKLIKLSPVYKQMNDLQESGV